MQLSVRRYLLVVSNQFNLHVMLHVFLFVWLTSFWMNPLSENIHRSFLRDWYRCLHPESVHPLRHVRSGFLRCTGRIQMPMSRGIHRWVRAIHLQWNLLFCHNLRTILGSSYVGQSVVLQVESFELRIPVHTCAHNHLGWQKFFIPFDLDVGQRCEGDVHDCLSSPCQNGGLCVERTDGVAGFTCECAGDWAGRLCEYESWSCGAQPCENNAQCITNVQERSKCATLAFWTRENVGLAP